MSATLIIVRAGFDDFRIPYDSERAAFAAERRAIADWRAGRPVPIKWESEPVLVLPQSIIAIRVEVPVLVQVFERNGHEEVFDARMAAAGDA